MTDPTPSTDTTADPLGATRRRSTGSASAAPWRQRWRAWVAQHVPREEELARHRWLRPIAHRLSEHGLWHMSTDSVARGAAIGIFWAFVIPFAQILFAAAHCVFWRGNIPVAAAITFITNPFTVGFWLWLGYKVGSLIVPPTWSLQGLPANGVMGLLQQYGLPAIVGMGLFAVGGALLAYLGVHAVSRLWVQWRYVRRLRRRHRR